MWVSGESGERKLGAIGVQISGGVSTHGLAFNNDPELSHFDHIVPCGLEAGPGKYCSPRHPPHYVPLCLE